MKTTNCGSVEKKSSRFTLYSHNQIKIPKTEIIRRKGCSGERRRTSVQACFSASLSASRRRKCLHSRRPTRQKRKTTPFRQVCRQLQHLQRRGERTRVCVSTCNGGKFCWWDDGVPYQGFRRDTEKADFLTPLRTGEGSSSLGCWPWLNRLVVNNNQNEIKNRVNHKLFNSLQDGWSSLQKLVGNELQSSTKR